MKKQLKLTMLILGTVVGTTASLISFPKMVLASGVTNTTTARANVSNIPAVAKLPTQSTSQTIEPNNKLSHVNPVWDKEILTNLQRSLPDDEVADLPARGLAVSTNGSFIEEPVQVAGGRGMASWYGPGFHGSRTANGESFNAFGLTAAHRSLPFGTRVKVTNLKNGRSVVVRINDRGPHIGGRIIDLSKGAARVIGVFQSGVAPVLLEVLGR